MSEVMTHAVHRAEPGDWVHARGLPGREARVGQIIEVMGRPGHEHFRTRWDEIHESILVPADDVTITPARSRPPH